MPVLNIKVYSKDNCMACKMTKKWLTKMSVPFEEINISTLPEAESNKVIGFLRNEVRLTSLPVITADGEEPFSGFDISKLRKISTK